MTRDATHARQLLDTSEVDDLGYMLRAVMSAESDLHDCNKLCADDNVLTYETVPTCAMVKLMM